MVGVERILQLLGYLSALIGVLSLIPFLDTWVLVLIGLGFVLGISGDRCGRYLLSNRLATVLSIGFFLLFISQATIANLATPLISLLCLLLSVRLASDKSARHLLQLFLLATIILAASSMLTLDLAYLFYLILLILLVTSGLVLLSFYVTDPQIRFGRGQWLVLLKTMALLPAGSLALMLVLFVILPRTQTPLWNFLNPKPSAMVGMTDQVQPGSVAELAHSTQIAFRAEVRELPAEVLYWRGVVLNRVEGKVWKRDPVIANEKLLADTKERIDLVIYSEPKADRYLVTLDRSLYINQVRHQNAPDGVSRVRDASRELSYRVQSQSSARSKQVGAVVEYLALPERFSGRLHDVADGVRRGKTYSEKLDLLDQFFLQQQLSYSTSQLPKTEHPVETFLFESHRGYCEYFASSYAVLLRLAGVPSRLVGGYLGGEYNRLGGYYLVGEDAAHVWVEALDDNGIWRRIDPSRLAINADDALVARSGLSIVSFKALTDAIQHNWSRLVLNYDLRQQFSLMRDMVGKVRALKKFESRSLLSLLWGLPILLPLAGWWFWARKKSRHERLLCSYRSFLAQAAGVGDLPADLGLFQLAKCSNDPRCQEFAELYGGAIYRDQSMSDETYTSLRQLLAQLKNNSAIQVALPPPHGDNE
ncbi:transglutaminaseTgpA domain-containing protein [Malonomonas rubra]|uniref:transglutaminase family protein n=1 Tax=Malonomonas rubra TaxID=57040 RepID=UPI0026EEBC60|nr:transglutaminaseTgpA domain-containing protein [Malonomonas rubra]